MAAPGFPKTSSFQFSVADLLFSPQADQLSMNTATHGVGMVKDIMVDSSPSIVRLTAGLENDVVYSAISGMNFKASASVYEYTGANLLYALSLDGTTPPAASSAPVALAGAVAAAATTFTMAGDQTTDFVAGAFCFLQEGDDTTVHISKIASSSYSSPNTTVTISTAVPTGMSFSTANGRAGTLGKIDADPNAANVPLSCRVIGTLVTDKRPCILHFPKIQIIKGFSVSWKNDNFGNLPFEWEVMTPLASDPGYSSDYAQRMSVIWPV